MFWYGRCHSDGSCPRYTRRLTTEAGVTRGRVMTRTQPAGTLAGSVNKQI
jgi:hypothetical protein